MTVEKGSMSIDELERIEVHGIPFGYKIITNNEGNTEIVVLPSPDEAESFNLKLKHFSYETLMLIRSKYFFGINHRAQMLEVIYNTFVALYKKEHKETNDFLTLQALYSEMIMKLGTILEDFAGMCYACKEYQLNGSDIAQVFLAYSDPTSFYKSIIEKKGKRKIKQIFDLPQSKGELNKIFKNLSEVEVGLLMKAIESSVTLIQDTFRYISDTIIRKTEESLTYNDIYNKTKHGFSPIYPFIHPVAQIIPLDTNELSIKEFISNKFFETLTIMHDKLPGQRTPEEQEQYKYKRLASPLFTYEYINADIATDVKILVEHITLIYRHLMKKYLRIAEGNNNMLLLLHEDILGEDEKRKVEAIINDESRYNK
ncbi:hypothetical protein V8Z81_30235 (plasmid) [Priestia megaterium]|uniref:hypothetical protein n=1 Tax=Priestia megaterium TaxID=1404 RepID=UPI0030CFBDA8